MAKLGRRQPFPPIIKRLIQYQPAATAPVAGKPLVVSLAANRNHRPEPFANVTINRLIQYQPIAPTAKKPFVVSQVAFEFRRPQILHPNINRLIQYQAPAVVADPVADTPYMVTQQAVEFRRPQILHPRYGRSIQYQPAPPIAKPPFIISFVAHNFRRPEFHGPIMGRVLNYAPPPPPPVARIPYLVSRVSLDEASRRSHLLRHPITVYPFHPPGTVIPAVTGVAPKFYIVHEVNDDNPRTRKALQMLSDITNGLLRSGELGGTIYQPYLGYKPENTINWSGDEPGSIQEALNRIAAALAALGQSP